MAERRAKGSGSLRHLGGDRWQVTVKKDGKRLSRVFSAPNATEANRAADAVRVELQTARERVVNEGDAERAERLTWTVEQYAAHYMKEWAPRKLAVTTRERYRQAIDNQIVPHLGKRLMAEVTVMDIVRMQTALAADGQRRYGGQLSAASITKIHNVLGAIFSYAVDVLKDFPTNPVHDKNAKPDNVDRDECSEGVEKCRALDVDEVRRFVALAKAEESPEVYAAIMLSARLGLRRGEAIAVQWRDVDFEKRRVTIRRAVSQAPEGDRVEGEKRTMKVSVKPTKTNKARYIPIGDGLISELKSIQARQAALRLAAHDWRGGKTPAEDHVTATPTGAVLLPEHYTSRFRALAKRHDIKVTPHLLRHSWCSQMIALGNDPVTVAGMSGHSPKVLMETYAHAFETRKREAVDAYDESWGVTQVG